ncbi:SAF domain-containing protein [Streptomyces rishiriensis]|uniref:SAF domain-containing protein n=1 Tax=Streptomyces rishiriensis TaxID=68264 RepID=UPI00379C13B1
MALFQRGKKSPEAPPVEAEAAQSRAARLPVAAPKRRTGALALALALAVIGALLMWMFQQSSAATQYLTVNREVDRGDRIEQGMLSTVDIVGEPAHLIPAERASEMIGKIATADLGVGSVLSDQNTAAALGVEEGRTVVGLALQAGRLPSRPLKAGDHVYVVYTPNSENSTAAGAPAPIEATVEGSGKDEASGMTVVDLNVATDSAATAAMWGARDAASVILGSTAAAAAPAPAPAQTPAVESSSPSPTPSSSASSDAPRED